MRSHVSTTINRPIEVTFDCITSVEFIQQVHRFFELEKGTTASEGRQGSEGVIGVGTTFVQRSESRDHPVVAKIEVIEYKRLKAFTLKVTRGQAITKIKWMFEPIPSASHETIVTCLLESMRQGWLGIVVGFMGNMTSSHSRDDSLLYMQNLKKYIEDRC